MMTRLESLNARVRKFVANKNKLFLAIDSEEKGEGGHECIEQINNNNTTHTITCAHH